MISQIIDRAYELTMNAALHGDLAAFEVAAGKLRTLDRAGEILPRQHLAMQIIAYMRADNATLAQQSIDQLGGTDNSDVQSIRQTLLTVPSESANKRFRDFVDSLIPLPAVTENIHHASVNTRKLALVVVPVIILLGSVIAWILLNTGDGNPHIVSSSIQDSSDQEISNTSNSSATSPEAILYQRMRDVTAKVILRLQILREDGTTVMVPISTGTAFVIAQDGLLLTNKHVIEDGEKYLKEISMVVGWDVIVVFMSDLTDQLKGRLERQSAYVDLATIRVDKQFEQILGFAPTPAPGVNSFAYGFPGIAEDMAESLNDRDAQQRRAARLNKLNEGEQPGLLEWLGKKNMQLNVNSGIISAVVETEQGLMLQTQAPVHSGNSGGPLLDKSGRVLGMITLKATASETVNLAIAGKTIYEELIREPGINWPDDW